MCNTESGYRNTTYAYGRNGELIGRYYKRHLPPSELYTLELAKHESIRAHKENIDWDDVYAFYGPQADDARKFNNPTITEKVDPAKLEANWQKIREIIASVPTYEECKAAMIKAGCKITVADIGKTKSSSPIVSNIHHLCATDLRF